MFETDLHIISESLIVPMEEWMRSQAAEGYPGTSFITDASNRCYAESIKTYWEQKGIDCIFQYHYGKLEFVFNWTTNNTVSSNIKEELNKAYKDMKKHIAVYEILGEYEQIFIKIIDIPDEEAKQRLTVMDENNMCILFQYIAKDYPEYDINWKNGEAELFECYEELDNFMINITVRYDDLFRYLRKSH